MPRRLQKLNVTLPVDGLRLPGELTLPATSQGLVLFAHGSGSSRHSPRNQLVARHLQERGIATLLFDLLTPEEDQNYLTRFDIRLLTERLTAVAQFVAKHPQTSALPLGLFGASTGAAAALETAARLGSLIKAVVSRGGRPDLAGTLLGEVEAATLLIVGGRDEPVLELNEDAYRNLRCEKRFVVIPRATHLFEEKGALEEVAELAAEWFGEHFQTVMSRNEDVAL